MSKPIDAEKTIRALHILHTSEDRSGESVWVDPSSVESRRVWYSWEDSTAGADDYSWTQEYYRVGIPLGWVEPLMLRANNEGRSEGVVPANCWSNVYVHTRSEAGGSGKTSPKFDEQSWRHELVLACLTLTPTTVAIEIRRTDDSPQSGP